MEDNSALWSALMRDQNGNMWNNPFMYLVWLALFNRNGGGFFGGGNGCGCGLHEQMADNQNFNSLSRTIEQAAGMSAEKAINAVALGDQTVLGKIAECCCNTQQNILKMGYENQLANERQTRAIDTRLDQLGNGMTQGFASVGYETQKQTCEIINNANANTQKIVDTMNQHWTQDLRDRLFEMSQRAQTSDIVNQLKPA